MVGHLTIQKRQRPWKIKEAAGSVGEAVEEVVEDTSDSVSDAYTDTMDKAEDMGDAAMDKAEDMGDAAMDKAEDMGDAMKGKAEDAMKEAVDDWRSRAIPDEHIRVFFPAFLLAGEQAVRDLGSASDSTRIAG